jgi:hypothetical protein
MKKYSKRISTAAIIITILIYLIYFIEPKIAINTQFNSLDKGNRVVLDFKFIQPPLLIMDRKFEIDDLSESFSKALGVESTIGGGSFSRDNKLELTAEYHQFVDISLRIKPEQINEIINSSTIKVSWIKLGFGKQERVYHISDYVK